MPVRKIIESRIVTVDVGSRIQIGDNRTNVKTILPCNDWDRAMFRWPNPIQGWEEKHAIAMNVEITGRTFVYRSGSYLVKLRITWVGDGEPDTFTDGWLLVNPHDCQSVETYATLDEAREHRCGRFVEYRKLSNGRIAMLDEETARAVGV
jgi:hypothetical protein